ncbi:hypothetical protein EJ06DRAFT_559274 [Trichodelitschia bisporula]|uniref:HIG1 domain-containing protein n=1 Tax=Trichodelitschia bisporula TaxID=703511 RepID=A0A6G1HM62_9PEZI|nr:hypothetical protein EJ06DRAFT_559274 [Trichodelitschia bisporula]
MRIISKEEEDDHYRATVKGGTIGGVAGLTVGTLGVLAANRRFPAFRNLTVPFRAFLAASTGTFSAIIAADRASARYEKIAHPERYTQPDHTLQDEINAQKSALERAKEWGAENRYKIVFGGWVAAMGVSLGLVRRNPYLTGQQKLVQARVYAQGLTIAILLASFMLEANDATKGKGRWETIKVIDPNDPLHKKIIEKRIHHERYAGEDQWREMVDAEERRMNERKAHAEAASK